MLNVKWKTGCFLIKGKMIGKFYIKERFWKILKKTRSNEYLMNFVHVIFMDIETDEQILISDRKYVIFTFASSMAL